MMRKMTAANKVCIDSPSQMTFDLKLRLGLTYTRPWACSEEAESPEIETKVETSVILRAWRDIHDR
jgi:hypothetical protein